MLIALALVAPAAWGAGSWFEIGTDPSPVNHDPNASADQPSLVGGNGMPYLAWTEADTLGGASAAVGQARAAVLAPDPLEPRPWQELLAPSGQPAPNDRRFSINLDPGHAATQTHLTLVTAGNAQTPYVVWIESDANGRGQVYVARWDGTAWQRVGGPSSLNRSPFDTAVDAAITSVNGTPYAAWTEVNGGQSQLYAKRFDTNTSAWVDAGSLINASPSGNAHELSMASVSGEPALAWSETPDNSTSAAIHVAHFVSGAWQLVDTGASPISSAGADAHRPSLTAWNGSYAVGWDEHLGTNPDKVFAKHYQAQSSEWLAMGGALNHDAGGDAREPSLASIDGPAWIAWVEQPSGGGAFLVHTARYDPGTATWTEPTLPINHDDTRSAHNPSLADATTIGGPSGPSGPIGPDEAPTVAWSENDAAGHEQIRSAAYGQPPQNTTPPQLSGEPKNGSQLSCTHGGWTAGPNGTDTPTSYTVLWERGVRGATSPSDPSWHTIAGAVGDSYTVQAADDGSRVRCRVVAAYGVVSAEAVSPTSLRTDADAPFNDASGQPFVTGTPIRGHTLTCNPGAVSAGTGVAGWHNNPDFTYQWTRSGQPIAGETGPQHQLTEYRDESGVVVNPAGDGSHSVGCTVVGHNDVGASPPAGSATVDVVDGPPRLFSSPKITLIPDVPGAPYDALKQTLSCSPGQWYDDYRQYQYQWVRHSLNGDVPIAGVTVSRYRPTTDDIGRTLLCQVTSTNPAGATMASSGSGVNITITDGLHDVEFDQEGPGDHPVDPTNLLAITGRYKAAIQALTLRQLRHGIDTATEACQLLRTQLRRKGVWRNTIPTPGSVHSPLLSSERCRILLLDPHHVTPYPDGGVRWTAALCYLRGVQSCSSLQIQVTPVDPSKPPALDSATLAQLGPSTPVAVVWYFTHMDVSQANCPGSAPVLRTIFRYHTGFDVRVVIVDADGTYHLGNYRLNIPASEPRNLDVLRSSQVFVCGTSLDPPPPTAPTLPCVTTAEIGPVHISHANLCPLSSRDIGAADFEGLLTDDLRAYLLAVADKELAASGQTAGARDLGNGDGPSQPVYVPWDSATQAAGDVTIHGSGKGRARDPGQRAGDVLLPSRTVTGTAGNFAATLAAEGSPSTFPPVAIGGVTRRVAHNEFRIGDPAGGILKFLYNADNAQLAYDQIYIARGMGGSAGGPAADGARKTAADGLGSSVIPGSNGDYGSLLVNGVGMAAVPDQLGNSTAALLIPSDVQGALPNVHSMTLAGRNIVNSMGVPTDPAAVPLGLAHPYKQALTDDATAAGQQALASSNITQMLDQYRKDGTAQGQALLKRVEQALDLGPFKLDGDADVKLEADGSATLTVGASVPGLTGSATTKNDKGQDVTENGSPIVARATIHADQQGHLALRGIHLEVGNAFLGGIALSGVTLDYNSTTGFNIKAKIIVPALDGQGLDIKNFQLGPSGNFQDLNIDYLAGAGLGIPLGYGVFITTVGADINVAADQFAAHVVFGIGSSVGAGCPPIGVDTSLQVKFSAPFSVDGDADVIVTCVKLANIHAHIDQSGLISLTGKGGFDAGPVYFHVGLGAQFDHGLFQVYGHGDGGIRHVLSGAVDAVISNRGVAACGSVDVTIPIVGDVISVFTGSRTIHVAGGASVDFKGGHPPLSFPEIVDNLSVFTGCDIGSYYPLGDKQGQATDARAGSSGFRLGPHAGPTLISIEGAGRAPRVILHSPSGQALDISTVTGNVGKRLPGGAWGTILDSENRTVVILPRPVGGVWTADVAAGSVPIVRIRGAGILPPPAVRVHVSGRRSTRTLRYTIVRERGQTVQFLELAPGENKQLGRPLSGGSGAIRYTVGEARSRRRQVVASVFQNGVPRKRLVVARYSAPNPAVGRVGHLRVRRSGRRAIISWSAAPLGNTYEIRVSRGDGEHLLRLSRAGVRRVSVPVARGEGLVATVLPRSAAGRAGTPASVRLTGSLLLGATHKLPPYRAPKAKKPKPKSKPKPKHK